MGKVFDKLMNTMRLNGDDYEEEYENNYDDDYSYEDEYDTYDEDYEAAQAAKKAAKKASSSTREKSSKNSFSSSSRDSKIVPIRRTQNIREVRVVSPTTFEAAKDIIDVLLEGQAAIINLEHLKNENFPLASRITDCVFGGCYALDGNIRPVTNFIFIVTPAGLEITGDIQDANNQNTNNANPTFSYQAR